MTQHYSQSEHFVLPDAPDRALETMIGVIANLQDIYMQETEALEASNVSSFRSLQQSKIEAARLYQAGITQIMQRKDHFKGVNPALRNQLKTMQADFSLLAHKNQKALSRMQRTTQRLTDTVCSAARKAAQQNVASGYGQTGAMDERPKGRISVGIQETA